MSFNNPHPDDITQQLLRSVSFLLVLSVAGVIALLMVKPSSYWHGATGESNQAPLPCIKDPSMEMWSPPARQVVGSQALQVFLEPHRWEFDSPILFCVLWPFQWWHRWGEYSFGHGFVVTVLYLLSLLKLCHICIPFSMVLMRLLSYNNVLDWNQNQH